jgi:hypothetical protein
MTVGFPSEQRERGEGREGERRGLNKAEVFFILGFRNKSPSLGN